MLGMPGYLALAADLHRPGVLRRTPSEAGAEAGKYRRDRKLRRSGGKLRGTLLLAKPGAIRSGIVAHRPQMGLVGIVNLISLK
jgi:hypothetical protein